MIRLFEQHVLRRVKELDGMWHFCAEGSEKNYELPVPGCWEQHPDFLNYRGHGTYRRGFQLSKSGWIRLEFKGVSHTADVYLDDVKMAHHYNAFTPFSFTAWAEAGMHELRVEVDNSFSEASALHVPNDYYTYGGITRLVALEEIAEVYIKNIHFTPYGGQDAWHGRTEVTLENLSDSAKDVTLSIALADRLQGTCEQSVTVAAHSKQVVSFDNAYADVTAWSHETPQLYLLQAVLSMDGQAVDDYIERIGFRTVRVERNKILLNNEPVYLKGFNRHEDYAGVGCAIPLQLMAQDMALVQDMGANAVRTCHYPNDERFLDLCDECGIYVWEENHARGFDLPKMQNPNFDRQCADCIDEMVANHYNHPSIVIWGILNECASETPEGREKYAAQYAQLRRLDATRPVTSATCRHFTDICLDLPDVVSFNMYSGWYQDCSPEERNREEIEWIRRAGGAGKPIIVSELGAAAIYGYRDRAHCKWSEERQAAILRENLSVYMADENITGVFVWQFADCRVTEEGGWFATRARSHNNKGVVDEYRRPKMAYDTVKEMFTTPKR